MDLDKLYEEYISAGNSETKEQFLEAKETMGDDVFFNYINSQIDLKKKDYPSEEITPIQGKMAGIQMPENTNLPTIDTQSIPNQISLLPTEQNIQNIHQDSSALGTTAEPISTVSELANGVSSLGENPFDNGEKPPTKNYKEYNNELKGISAELKDIQSQLSPLISQLNNINQAIAEKNDYIQVFNNNPIIKEVEALGLQVKNIDVNNVKNHEEEKAIERYNTLVGSSEFKALVENYNKGIEEINAMQNQYQDIAESESFKTLTTQEKNLTEKYNSILESNEYKQSIVDENKRLKEKVNTKTSSTTITTSNPVVEEPLIDNIKPSVNKQFYGIDANGETILISAKNFTQTDKNLIAKDGNTYPIYEREGLSFIDTNEGLKLVGKDGDVSQYPVFGRDFEFYKGKFLLNSEKEDQPTDYYQERRKNFHYVAGGRLSSGVAEKDISGNYISLEDETALYKSYESKGYGNIVGIDEQSKRPIFQLNEVGAETLNKQNGFSVPSDYEKGKAYALDSNRVMSNINEGKEIEDNERQRQERILGRKVDGALLTEEEINEELITKRTQQLVLQGLNNQQALEQAGREFASSQQQKRNETNNWIDYIISEAERNAEPYNASNGKSFKYHQFTNSERDTWQSLRDDINFAEFINSDYAKNKYGTKGDGLEYHFENSKLRKSFLNDYVQYKQKQINDNRRALNSTRDRQLRTDIRVAIDNGDDDALAVARGKREPIERAYQSIQQKALSNSILANKIENGFDVIKKEDEELAKEYAGYQNGRFGDIVSYTGKSIINGGGKLITDIAGGLLSLGGMFSDRINSAHTAFNVENAQALNILSGNTTDKVTVYQNGDTIVEERLGRMFIKGKDGKLTFSEELTYNPKAFEGYEKKDQYTDENIANWAGVITNQVGMMYIPSVGGGLLAKATANSARLNKVIAASANALGKEHMLTKSLVSFSHNSKNLYTSALWATEVQNQNYSEAKNSGLTRKQSGIYSLIQSGLTGVMIHLSPDDKFFKGYDAAKKELISLIASNNWTKAKSYATDFAKKVISSNRGELLQENSELIAQNIVNSAFNSAIGEDKLRTWEIDELFETTKSTLGVTTFLETFNYLTRGRVKTRGLNAMEKMVVASQIPEIQRQLQEVENGIWSSSLKQDARDALQYIDKIQKYTKQIPDDVQLKVSETASLVMSMDKIAEYEKKKNETTYPSIKESYEEKIQAENEKIKNILSNANKQTSDGNNVNDNAPEEQSNILEEDKNNNNTITGVNSGELPANNEQEANSRTEEIQQIEQGKPIENHISTPTSTEQGNTTEEEEQALPITAENKVPENKAEENAPEDDVEEDIDYIEDENGINDKLIGLSPVNEITPSNSVEAQPTKENLSKEGQGDESNLQGIQTPHINEIEGEILMEGNNNIPTTPTSTNQATTEEVKPLNKGRKIEYNNKEYYPRPDGGFNAFDKNGKLRKVTNKNTIAKLKELSNGENEAKQKAEDWIAYKNKRVTKPSTAKVPETKESKGNVLHWRTLFNSVNDELAKIQVLVDKLWHSNKDMSDSDLTDMLDVAEQLSDNYNDKYRIFDTMRRATNNQDILNRAKRLEEELDVRVEKARQEIKKRKEAEEKNTKPNSNDDVDFQVSEDYSSLSDRELKDEIQAEREQIIAQAKANGTYMKAPNGKPTNLNEEQWVAVRTQRFKDWFGDWEKDPENSSKVVDDNGEPLVVYHGTNANFNTFTPSIRGKMGKGIYFTPSQKTAKKYAQKINGERVIPAFIDIKQPLYLDNPLSSRNVKEEDGIVAGQKYGKEETEILVFHPNQIKSATDNVGTYSEDSNDIRYQVSEDYSSLSDRELKDEIQRIGDKIQNDIAGTKGFLERSKARINHPLYAVWKELTDLKIERYQEQKKRREEEEKNNPRVVYTPKREDLKISEYNGERTIYHGTKKDVADKIVKEGIKFGSELSDTDWRGGGYGVLDQESFSTSLNPNISKSYSGEHNVGIVKLELNPGANVVTIENEIYAEDLKEYQKELEGVDAVYLKNSGEEELVILNKEAVKVVEAKSFKVSENVVRFQKNKNTPYKKGKISQKAFDKLIAKLKKPFAKAFKNINILTDWEAFERKVEEYRKKKKGGVDYQNVNEEFNRRLDEIEQGKLGKPLSLGKPNAILRSAGISDREILLQVDKIVAKAKKHGYKPSDIKGLVEAINNPIAVFKGSQEGSFAVLTEVEINDNKALVSISVGKNTYADFSMVSSVYGKSKDKIVDWINKDKVTYVDKEKSLDYLLHSAPIAGQFVNQGNKSLANLRDSAPIADSRSNSTLVDTNVQKEIETAKEKIKNFQNPKIENDLEYMRTPSGVIYGAKLPDGTIYINPEHLNANTAIHEFGHIWEQLMPNRFAKGVELLKNTKAGKELFQELRNNKGYKNYSDEKLWSEALVTMLGNRGEELYHSNSTSRFVAWVKDFFKAFGDMLYKLSNGLVGRELTPEDKLSTFVKGALIDIMSGKEIIPESNIATKEVPIYLKDMDNSEIKQVLDRLGLIKPAQCA